MSAPANTITMLVMDVDGVLTDGAIIYDDQGHELKRFCARDGLWIKAWLAHGFSAAVISSRASKAVQRRMDELGVEHVIQGALDKAEAMRTLARTTGVHTSAMAFIGDDLPDLAAMRVAAYAIAPADADPLVRAAAAHIAPTRGGHGCVRDAIMHLFEARGLLDEAIAGLTMQ